MPELANEAHRFHIFVMSTEDIVALVALTLLGAICVGAWIEKWRSQKGDE